MMPGPGRLVFNNIDANGQATTPITNELTNFGWEYVYHCHILSHEEMDMMRPMSLAVPPYTPDGLSGVPNGTDTQLTFYWNDTSISETSFLIQKSADGVTWQDVTSVDLALDGRQHPRDADLRRHSLLAGSAVLPGGRQEPVGYGGDFMSLTVKSTSDPLWSASCRCSHHHRPQSGRGTDCRWNQGHHHRHQLRRHGRPPTPSPSTASTPSTRSTRPLRSPRYRPLTPRAR